MVVAFYVEKSVAQHFALCERKERVSNGLLVEPTRPAFASVIHSKSLRRAWRLLRHSRTVAAIFPASDRKAEFVANPGPHPAGAGCSAVYPSTPYGVLSAALAVLTTLCLPAPSGDDIPGSASGRVSTLEVPVPPRTGYPPAGALEGSGASAFSQPWPEPIYVPGLHVRRWETRRGMPTDPETLERLLQVAIGSWNGSPLAKCHPAHRSWKPSKSQGRKRSTR